MVLLAEYLWLDGATPVVAMRSKTKVMDNISHPISINDFLEWNFDGSSTYQAPGDKSDLILKPVRVLNNPLREGYLVLCEVFHVDGYAVPSNTRAILRELLAKSGHTLDMWIGFEQEYTLFHNDRPLGWPKSGFLEPQGPFYCGAGADRAFGRSLVEKHMDLCLKSGLLFCGINAEVMPAQWEFQIGPRGFVNESADPLTVCDQTWVARWLLQRLGEEYGIVISFANKPIKGDWNGSGMHTNFSTKAMRDKDSGWSSIERIIDVLKHRHHLHIKGYGHGLDERLTGKHETCDINTFRAGISDRGASIRISPAVAKNKCGYLEDRRPGANCDPYTVASLLLEAAIIAER